MAKPIYYPDWATDNVNLPTTGKTNKVRPREIIRTTGWDKGQIPTAEELNYWFNNTGLWIHYLVDEFIPTVPQTYLPKTGTTAVFSGDLTGTLTWNGTNQATGNIQVVDNSHNHLSANISDATSLPTPNMIVRRDGNATIIAGDIISRGTNATLTDTPTFFLQTYNGQTVASIDCQNNVGGALFINKVRADNQSVPSQIILSDGGYVQMNNPRSSTAQEGAASSLVRLDYLNTAISNLNNSIYGSYVADIRLGSTYTKLISKNTAILADAGGVLVGYYFEGDNPQGDTLYMKPIQKAVGGNWYTIGQL